MTQEFKVGDKVRVVNTLYTDVYSGYRVGDIFKVKKVWVESIDTVDGPRLWYQEVEKVSNKSQRITDAELAIKAMQYEIAELKFEVATLKQSRNTGTAGDFLAEIRADKTPNEKRKAVIEEAKAFVAKYEAVGAGEPNKTRKGTNTARSHYYETEFTVKDSKVTAVIYRLNSGRARQSKPSEIGRSKCAPDDVFNADIGKAIALGRALGLDVTRFEQAVKPTEFVVGQIVDVACVMGGSYLLGEVTKVKSQSRLYFEKCGEDDYCGVGYFTPQDDIGVPSNSRIVDDTGAQY